MVSSLEGCFFTLAYLTFCSGSSPGAFFAVAPNEFRPGWPLTIAVTAHQNAVGKVFVSAMLGPKEDKIDVYSSISDVVNPGETKLLKMQIPEIVLNPGSHAVLTVTTTGAVVYSSEQQLWYNPTSSLVFVETDKAIYKPGQKVHFRVVHVDKQLKPIIKPLTAVIVNPKDSKLEEYKDIASRTGVAEMTYQLLQSASVGKWKIRVSDDANMLYTKEFTVEEYVLPKFSVEVKANPGNIVAGGSNPGSVITVDALYTFGKGVQGTCVLIVSEDSNNMGKLSIRASKQLNPSGKVEFSDLAWGKFFENFHMKSKVLVTAVVTDETGRAEVGQTSVMIYRSNTKVEILPKSTRVFRAGIPAEIFIRVSDQNGNPVKPSQVDINIHVPSMKSVQAKVTVPEGQTDISYNFTPEIVGNQTAYPQLETYSSWRESGMIRVTLTSDSEITTAVSAYLYQTQSGSVIAIVPVTDKIPKVGEKIQYKIVKNSKDVQQTVGYLVISQGMIVEAGVPVDDLISIEVTMETCPHAQVFVYMIVGEAHTEVVTDVFDVSPTLCFQKEVDVSFDAAQIRSGADTTMKVRVNRLDGSNALPGVHTVYYLGIDKSLVLLQGRTDLNKEQVLSGMSNLTLKSRPEMDAQVTPHSAGKMIESLGLVGISSKNVLITVQLPQAMPVFSDLDISLFSDVAAASNGEVMFKKGEDESQEISQTENTKVRTHFPETWLWGQAKTDMSGHLNQAVTLPDTITTWLVSAFAVSDEGLVVGTGPFELAAFQVFFLTMNLPYSIKRGEVFILRITVFNYRNKDVTASLRLAASSQFSVIDSQEQDGWLEKNLAISANRASSVEFKINATTLGLIELHVVAQDVEDGMKDEVKQKLLVKPEGEMRSRAITKAIFLKSETSLGDTFVINWPEEKIVPGSKKVEVKVTGDIMGQSLSNLQRLVSIPYGCGEQNMISTVPNIFGLTYIRSTAQTGTSNIEKDMIVNMKTGYQRQIDMYRHSDGSYSAWGPQKHDGGSRGSTWLTAFVLKSFSRAAEFITVDPAVLSSGAKFISSQQNSSGEFIETGQVFDSYMQSGTGSGPSLTIFVLISLLETDHAAGGELLDLQKQIDLALSFIKQNLKPASLRVTNNKILAAMAAYALSLMSDSSLTPLVDELLAVVTDLGAPWLIDVPSQDKKMAPGYIFPTSGSQDVETAAYYLLALTHLHRLSEGSTVMKWLQSQQNSYGGYQSTQDTVMALQALAEFGVAFKESAPVSFVIVSEPESGQSFNVSLAGSRAVLLHTVELPEDTKTIEVTVNGPVNSFCVLKVVYTYYTLPGDDDLKPAEPRISVLTKTSKLSHSVHNVEVCVKSSSSLKYKGMFVTTLTLPSGEQAFDEPSTILANNPRASRVETAEGVIHFYMDEAPGVGYCLQAQVERQTEFEVQKPGSAKMYAYYEPGTSQEVSLVLNDLPCINDECGGNDGAIIANMANVLLTITVCTLITLLICM